MLEQRDFKVSSIKLKIGESMSNRNYGDRFFLSFGYNQKLIF